MKRNQELGPESLGPFFFMLIDINSGHTMLELERILESLIPRPNLMAASRDRICLGHTVSSLAF